MSTKDEIAKFICTEIITDDSMTSLAEDFDIIDSGLLDSLATVSIMQFMEEKFEIIVDPSEVTPENFRSVATLAEFVESKKGA